jgi:hypothetical protein
MKCVTQAYAGVLLLSSTHSHSSTKSKHQDCQLCYRQNKTSGGAAADNRHSNQQKQHADHAMQHPGDLTHASFAGQGYQPNHSSHKHVVIYKGTRQKWTLPNQTITL